MFYLFIAKIIIKNLKINYINIDLAFLNFFLKKNYI